MRTVFSEDRVYRYSLWREWEPPLFQGQTPESATRQFVMFVCLNPSTADETNNDPTVRRCINYSKHWGYTALCMTNLFAYRSTDRRVLPKVEDPVGPDNDHWLAKLASEASIVVVAWGKDGKVLHRDRHVLNLLRRVQSVYCLSKNEDGSPEHPLYLSKELRPEIYSEGYCRGCGSLPHFWCDNCGSAYCARCWASSRACCEFIKET